MKKNMSFEEAMENISRIVSDLESGEVGLEDAIKKYEEGVKLTHFCNQQLNKADQKIEILTKKLDGSFDTETFNEANAAEAEGSPEKKVKPKQKEVTIEDDDEDILF